MERNHDNMPRWPFRFLELICPDYLFEEIEGDLIQRFNNDVKKFGTKKAKQRLVWNAIRFFRPGILLRNKISVNLLPLYMIANYFKIASRVMLRNTSFSFINIAGLSLGITSAILLFLWIGMEFSYDQFHVDKERIYKAWNRAVIDGEIKCWDRTPHILAPTLTSEYTAVEDAVSFIDYGAAYLFTAGDVKLMKNSGAFADNGFLRMFSFPLLEGDTRTALSDPNSVVITESFAKQLFGDRNAFGEMITISDAGYSFSLKVSGVLKDLPPNTDFRFEYLIPFSFLESIEGKNIDWGNNNVGTFVKVNEGADVAALNDQIKTITIKHSGDKENPEIFLYPLTSMHLYSGFENGVQSGGRIEIMRMIIILGICLVAIACINFINLSTARAQKRAKEVGIRKVTGAYRFSLVTQFLCESVLLALIAGVISLAISYLLLPAFNELIQHKLTFDVQNISFWIVAFGGIVFIGLVAGSYPALYLSSFKPVKILKGSHIVSGKSNFRRVLVVIQFGLAITMIFSAIVVRKQIIYVQNRESGYDKNNLVYHFITGDLEKNYGAYKRELLQSGIAASVTKTSSPITEGWSNTWTLEWKGKDPQSKTIIDRFYVDEFFTKTAGVSLIAGRDMDLAQYPSDSTAVLLNETAVRIMGFDNPIGEIIKDGRIEWHVIGVVEDFILTSPFRKVQPMILAGSKGWFTVVHIRLNDQKPVQECINGISKLFSKYNPAYPFDYNFVDTAYRKKFTGIETTLKITTIFSFIIVFIACLGLLGLSMYMIETKIKEIGIRKVLGGSVFNITKLLCWSSIKPILIAILIFSPQAWFAMNWWLQSYEYRISLNGFYLLGAALILIAIAVITIGVQTVRAARTNPVNSLRSE